MENQNHLTSLSEVLNELSSRGINDEFIINDKGNVCVGNDIFKPNQIILSKTYRFEGQSDPDDQAIIYLISLPNGKQAFSIDAYGLDATEESENFLKFIRHIRYNHIDE